MGSTKMCFTALNKWGVRETLNLTCVANYDTEYTLSDSCSQSQHRIYIYILHLTREANQNTGYALSNTCG